MDPRRLLIFRAVARGGSLSAAARELGWTQPAVGQHLRALEREVATPLVIRTAGGVRLTEAGTALLRHADALAGRLAVAEDELATLADLRAGRLRIASFPSAAATLLPPLLTGLAAAHPGLDVRLLELEPPAAIAALRAGDCDLALVFAHASGPAAEETDLAVHPLGDDPVRAVLPASHRLAGRREIALARLAGERWVAGCPRCRDDLLRSADAAGFAPDIRHETDDYVVVQNLVAGGLAVALLPELALAAHAHPGVAVVPVRGHRPRRLAAVTVAGGDGLPAARAAIGLLSSSRSSPRAG